MPYHAPPASLRFRRLVHRLSDPIRSLPDHRRARASLAELPDGDYDAGVNVPYVPQFATPSLIRDYIHGNLHGRDDPNWRTFGAPDPDTYTFWAQRSCAIACLKMGIDAFGSAPPEPLWTLVQDGIARGGYRLQDADGSPTDQGWFFEPLVRLGVHYGLAVAGLAYISELRLCERILERWLIAAAVTPEIGERGFPTRYDGHFVLVYGFRWRGGRIASWKLHNPSGRYPELQAGATVSARRFRQTFAHRCILFRREAD